jgi:hypothetical protein
MSEYKISLGKAGEKRPPEKFKRDMTILLKCVLILSRVGVVACDLKTSFGLDD